MSIILTLTSWLILVASLLSHHANARPEQSTIIADNKELTTVEAHTTLAPMSSLTPTLNKQSTVIAISPSPSPKAPVYKLGTKPGGLRLVEAAEGTRIIFLFDFKPVPLFRREGLRLPRPQVITPSPPTDNLLADTHPAQRDTSR